MGTDDLDVLKRWNGRCVELAQGIIQGAAFKAEDHLAFMSLCFTSKQIEHMESLNRLVPHRDAMLVARAMLEGQTQLYWAQQGDRALRWRTFAYVSDWRLMRLKEQLGTSIPPEDRAKIEQRVADHGDVFLTGKAVSAKKAGGSLPDDPYERRWLGGNQVRQLLEKQKAAELYPLVYQVLSDWAHSGVASIIRGIRWTEETVKYDTTPTFEATHALKTGFYSLLQTATVANRCLRAGREQALLSLGDDWFREAC